MKKILFVGNGGHYNSVIDSIDFDYMEFLWVEDMDIIDLIDMGIEYYHVSFGDILNRKRMIKLLESYNIKPINIIDKTAIISKTASIGHGNFIGKNVVINSNTIIGNNNIINTSSVIEHDVNMGDNNHIAPTACILGGINICNNNFFGANSVIKNGISIGNNNTIGANVFLRKSIDNDIIHYER